MFFHLSSRLFRQRYLEFALDRLPEGCEETRLGWLFGASRQWRGPNGLHVREHDGKLFAHYDRVDPRHNLLGHLILDMRRELTLGMSASAGLVAFITAGAAPALLWGSLAGASVLLATVVARARS